MKENKIIPFRSPKKIKRTKNSNSSYRLVEIQVYILRNGEKYNCNWFARDSDIMEEEIYDILNKVLRRLIITVPKIEIKLIDQYEINFTIFYYENIENADDFNFIYQPSTITKEKLTEYIYTTTEIYNYKKV